MAKESKIVAAAGTAGGGEKGGGLWTAAEIERVQAEAVEKALKEGISMDDGEEILKRKVKAREEFKAKRAKDHERETEARRAEAEGRAKG